MVEMEPKTDSGKRAITLPEYAMEPLRRHIDSLNKTQGLMFTTSTGQPIPPVIYYAISMWR